MKNNNNQLDEGSVKRFEYHGWVKGTSLKSEKKLRYHPYTRLDFKFDFQRNK